MCYFYIDSRNQQQGPVDRDKLVGLGLTPETYVWCQGMKDWQQAKSVPDLAILFHSNPFRKTDAVLDSSNNQPQPNGDDMQYNEKQNASSSKAKAFLHLLYAVLWFAGAGLITWGLIWLFTESKGGRVKAMGLIAPFYFAWYGIKDLVLFFKLLFS